MVDFFFRYCPVHLLILVSLLVYILCYTVMMKNSSPVNHQPRSIINTKYMNKSRHSLLNEPKGTLVTKSQDEETILPLLPRNITPKMVLATNLSNLDSLPELKYLQKELPKWTKKYEQHGLAVTEVNKTEVTNSRNSRYQILNSEPIYKGDTVKVRIEARDGNGNLKKHGGDYWVTWLESKMKPVASTTGAVTDFNNGTYEVNFIAGWAGNSTVINIVLLHPSEAASIVKHITWQASRIFWLGKFIKGKVEEVTNCSLQTPDTWTSKMCLYFQPSANGRTAFACEKPNKMSCSSMAYHMADGKRIKESILQLIKNNKFMFESIFYSKRILGNVNSFSIKDSEVILPPKDLPECRPHIRIPPITGFWLNGTWNSLVCRINNCWNNVTLAKCLQNKTLQFLGDSNSRQFAAVLLDIFKIKYDPNARPWHSHINDGNITVYWHFHPHWIGGKWAPFYKPRHEADLIDSFVSSDCNYILVISTWAHFIQWPRDAIIGRLLLLRQAINRFHARCPNAPVVIKGPHARNHAGFDSRIYNSDFLINEFGKLLRNIFDDTEGVLYLDIYDMNLAYPSSNNVHMPDQEIRQELNIMWSYICNCDDDG